jgi:hypothetical protein
VTRPQTSEIDLPKTFSAVTRKLKANQEALNAADEYNHNHGDNMVKNFQTITKAMRERKESPPAEQLAHASEVLARRSQSGSAQLYAQGLAQAAQRLQGERAVTPENAMLLIQALMGGETSVGSQPQAMGDLFGTLLGGQAAPSASQAAPAGDLSGMLGQLLGGGGASQSGQTQGGLDMTTLLNAGMAFLQARQEGAEPMQALIQAVMSGSQMSGTTHHSQSGQLVTETLLETVGTLLGGKKRPRRKKAS